LERGIKKILVVNAQIFKKLENDFKLFFQGLKARSISKSWLLRATGGRILGPQRPSKAYEPKIGPEDSQKRFDDYKPTNAIYCNNSDQRRWFRVKEWFTQYAQTDF
jgi:hypothetical protein